jgi:hypothetical protein
MLKRSLSERREKVSKRVAHQNRKGQRINFLTDLRNLLKLVIVRIYAVIMVYVQVK